MQIRWNNIFGVLLLIFCVYVFVKLIPALDRWLDGIANRNYLFTDTPTEKVMLLGLLCVTAIVIAKIISNIRR